MTAVATGFATIFVAVTVGYVVGGLKAFPQEAQRAVAAVAFYVGTPAKMFQLVSRSDLNTTFSAYLIAVFGSVTLALIGVLVLGARLSLAERVMTYLGSSYLNAVNLGLPITHYVLGDATLVAPVFLVQVTLLQPTALLVLDVSRSTRLGPRAIALLVLANPITVGTLLGTAVSLAGWQPPEIVAAPIDLLAETSIPLMLLAFGLGLRATGLPRRLGRRATAMIVAKCLLMPAAAWAIAAALGLSAEQVHAAVVIAALPTAQVVLVHAVRYDVDVRLIQQVMLFTTLLSVPTIWAAELLL